LAELMRTGSFAVLEARARELLAQWPQSGVLWQLLGIALSQQGKDPLEALRAAVTCLPDDPAARVNLGNALGRRGSLEEAAAQYERALVLQPDFAEGHLNLGSLRLEQGRPADALLSFRRAVELRSGSAAAHAGLGVSLMKNARAQEAVGSLQRAVAIDPSCAQAHASLANAQRMLGHLDEAVQSYRRAVAIKPDFVRAHLELATVLRLQRRGEQAQSACREALRLDPQSAGAWVVLAELRADNGEFTEAEELFKRAAQADPGSVDAWVGLSRVRRMTAADSGWYTAVATLLDCGLTPQREMSLRYAIGKYFDDLGDYPSAFESYRRANELARQCGPAHDRARLSETLDRLIHAQSRDWLQRNRPGACTSSRPVFVVGMLRSGTTLAEQILASHPAVFGAGELTFWSSELARLAGGFGAGFRLDDTQLADKGAAYLSMLDEMSAGAERVVDKLPTNFLALGLIRAALPGARFIHLRRNPIDTCLSIYFQHLEAINTYANDLEDLAHYYGEYQRLMSHWRQALPAGTLLEVPYEGLVEHTGEWARRMLEFVSLPWDPRCLQFQQTRRAVVTASKWQVRQAIGSGSIGRWRHYERFIGPLLKLA